MNVATSSGEKGLTIAGADRALRLQEPPATASAQTADRRRGAEQSGVPGSAAERRSIVVVDLADEDAGPGGRRRSAAEWARRDRERSAGKR